MVTERDLKLYICNICKSIYLNKKSAEECESRLIEPLLPLGLVFKGNRKYPSLDDLSAFSEGKGTKIIFKKGEFYKIIIKPKGDYSKNLKILDKELLTLFSGFDHQMEYETIGFDSSGIIIPMSYSTFGRGEPPFYEVGFYQDVISNMNLIKEEEIEDFMKVYESYKKKSQQIGLKYSNINPTKPTREIVGLVEKVKRDSKITKKLNEKEVGSWAIGSINMSKFLNIG